MNASGYEVHRRAIPCARITDVLAVMRHALAAECDAPADATLAQLIQQAEAIDHGIVYRAGLQVGSSAAAVELIAESSILTIARIVAGTRNIHVMPLHVAVQLPSDPRFDYKWHQEAAFYPWCRDIINMWMPLGGQADREHGTVLMIPGSHLGGVRDSTRSGEGKFLQIEPVLRPGEADTAVTVEATPGDLVVFDANMVHASHPNTSAEPRVFGVLRIVNMETQARPRPLYKALSYET